MIRRSDHVAMDQVDNLNPTIGIVSASAEAANTAATTAQTAATNAQTSADSAQTAATSAQASADTAQATAVAAQTAADNAQTTADGKNVIFYAASAPTAMAVNDLWFDTSNGSKPSVWNGTSWVAFQFDTQAVSFNARDIGGVTTTIAASAPGSPLTGDIWYDTTHGYRMNRWDGSAWVAVQFGTDGIADAAVTASKITFTARDIGGVTTTISTTAPASPLNGDLWYDSSNGYKLNQWSGTAWTAVQFGTNAIAAGSVTAALIAGHTITAAQIAAGTITATEIAASTITASNIAANTITAAQIAANTITAAQIAAGTVTATELAANSVTSAKIAAGAVTATQIAAGTVVSGIVDATTIDGAQFVAHGTSGEILVYDGSPAAGNLILSVAPSAGADSHGNQYVQGLTLQASALNSGKLNFLDAAAGSVAAHIETLFTGTLANDAMVINSQGDLTLSASGSINICPPGTILMYGGSSAPNSSWLLCDGSAVSRTTHAALFAVIGTTYGAGDGSTTFNLPDFGSKFPRGNAPGTGGGVDSHSHPLSDSGYAQIQAPGNTIGMRRVAATTYTTNREMTGSSNSAGGSPYSFGAALRGATDSASNVPAYTGVAFIIKT